MDPAIGSLQLMLRLQVDELDIVGSTSCFSYICMNRFVTVFGYGSLMNRESAMRTMPSLTNFRKGILEGYRREYSLVSISGLKNGAIEPFVAALAIRKVDTDEQVIGCIFDIPEYELEPYFVRESRYCRTQVEVVAYDDSNNITCDRVLAWTVIEQTDGDYRARLLKESKSYEQEVGCIYPSGKLWGRTDILPMPSYFELVLHSAHDLDRAYGIISTQDLNQLDSIGFKFDLFKSGAGCSKIIVEDDMNMNVNLSCVHNLLHQGYLADRSTTLYRYILRRVSKL